MRKLIVLLFPFTLLFGHVQGYSQINNGIVYYKFEMVEDIIDSTTAKKKGKEMLNFINESLTKNAQYFRYKLLFNDKESYYSMVDTLVNEENKGYKYAKILNRSNDIFYTNFNKDEALINKTAFGKLFLIKSNITDRKWELHNEQRKIGKYLCFKATSIKIVNNSKGIFEKKIIAWYTPDISIQFGPRDYFNLPGLILELQEDKFRYFASKIILNPKKKVNIKPPVKGKKVAKEEYEDIISETSYKWSSEKQ